MTCVVGVVIDTGVSVPGDETWLIPIGGIEWGTYPRGVSVQFEREDNQMYATADQPLTTPFRRPVGSAS